MARRIHVPHLAVGELALDAAQVRHARSVLRLADGAAVEVFDDAGNVADGVLVYESPAGARVRVGRVDEPDDSDAFQWVVAAAVPKGERADWMVEKLSELGAAAFVPLAAARSVVLPEGKGKRDRWARLATESAKQSRRRGVMRIDDLTPLAAVVAQWAAPQRDSTAPATTRGWYLSTAPDAVPAGVAVREPMGEPFLLLIGPEGGWTPAEAASMRDAGLTPVGLTRTILRVETAAVAAATVVAVVAAYGRRSRSLTESDPSP